MASIKAWSESGLELERSRPYRTDSCSIRAAGGTPPSASLEDISEDEKLDIRSGQVSDWLSLMETESDVDSEAVRNFDFISDTITADLFSPFQFSGSAYFHFMNITIMADMFSPLSIIRKCVFPFHKQYNDDRLVPATDYQEVRNSISFATPSRLTCSPTFNYQEVCISIS